MGAEENRVAIVMAASKGLGRGSAEALARAGHHLLVCSRSEASLAGIAATARELGVHVEVVPADVSQADQLAHVFSRADEVFGRLDVLVSNAGGPPPGAFMSADDAAWDTAYQLTLMSAVRSMRAAVPLMRRHGYGRIVVIGSSSVKQPIANLVLSNTFRPALVGATKTLSQEVARDGITVNMVSPGRIDTDRVRSLDERRAQAEGVSYDEFRRSYEGTIPAGHYGQVEDVGALVAFLASPQAGYITGQSIIVDGGMVNALP